jgi:hypothetical protein
MKTPKAIKPGQGEYWKWMRARPAIAKKDHEER